MKISPTNSRQVALSPKPTARIVFEKVWNSSQVQTKLALQKNPWVYDGAKLAW
jgi:hypothetical protein